jgi:hypothetical protein
VYGYLLLNGAAGTWFALKGQLSCLLTGRALLSIEESTPGCLATHGYAVTADAERRRREMDCMLKRLKPLNEESYGALRRFGVGLRG